MGKIFRVFAALAAVSFAVGGCQTAAQQSTDDAVLQLAGRLLAVPLLLERCAAVDPTNRLAYLDERARYEAENRWVSDAVYKAMGRKVGSTREGLEAFVRGVGERRMTELMKSYSESDVTKGCLKALAQCKMREPKCGPIDKLYPDQVRAAVAEATL